MFSALHDCGHVSVWRTESTAPQAGHLITCAHCGEATRVVGLYGPWRARCKECRRVNHHATFKRTVERAAIAHVQEWTTHHVWVWQYGVKESAVLVTSTNAGVQTAMLSDAPF